MSIGFTFTGKVKNPETLLRTAEKLAEERHYRTYQWEAPDKHEAGLNLNLCPMGGDLRLTWKKEGGLFAQYAVEGECVSTPAGPGLHKAAVEALDELGIQKLEVEDETDYYRHRDFERMLQEHFHRWLKTVADVCDQKVHEGLYSQMCMCWDLDSYMPGDVPGTAVTPVGRFSFEWLKNTLEQQGVEAVAERFFLWYHPGEWDALFHRNLALNQLWENCFFAPSSRSGEDANFNNAICANLELAAQMDPSLPLPRKAYAEVCALAGRTPELPTGPELELEFEPGFRKGLVVHSIGPLRLTLPGVYRFEWEEWDEKSGCHKWWDESGGSPIWRVNGYRMRQGDAAFTPVLQDDNDLTEFAINGGAVRYGWRALEEDGEPCFQVRAEVITGPSLFVITVSHTDQDQRPGIIELMKKITVNVQNVEKHTVQAE